MKVLLIALFFFCVCAPSAANAVLPGCKYFPTGLKSDGVTIWEYLPGSYYDNLGVDQAGLTIPPNVEIPGLTSRLIICMRYMVDDIGYSHIASIRSDTQKIVGIALTLYIMFYGMRIVFTGIQLGEGMMTIFIFLGVIWGVTGSTIETYTWIFRETQKSMVDMVTHEVLVDSHGICEGVLDSGGSVVKPYITVWQKLDCVFAHVLGVHRPRDRDDVHSASADKEDSAEDFDNPAEDPYTDEAITAFALNNISGGLATSANAGLMVAVFGPGLILSAVAALAHAVMIYLSSMLIITFLGIVAPIIIPLALFDVTRRVFTQWFQFAIVYTIGPSLYMAFVTLFIFLLIDFYSSPCGMSMHYEYAKGKIEDFEKETDFVRHIQQLKITSGGDSGDVDATSKNEEESGIKTRTFNYNADFYAQMATDCGGQIVHFDEIFAESGMDETFSNLLTAEAVEMAQNLTGVQSFTLNLFVYWVLFHMMKSISFTFMSQIANIAGTGSSYSAVKMSVYQSLNSAASSTKGVV